ncbi:MULTISPECIES: hypothetical protein [unclassified Pseudoalteromonas]|uniref:hypothetical protein n=1 Tax=unclassified Pseudoalteromonas TaxID=194690 RepID=UPI001F45A717|nr:MULTISPECIES: hypothetical protein [unclassified Pseudoalteromonas]MCF2825715.1 hypothetical protein [Pseudoalteromonas sp. OF5H-5]MCF2832139.1 hypothetical protein [Pseudoalteromonas sp. DL2-H6]MCF2923725.1 hypothetical protein [Pseudoalteromonas sp. DL2-H1]
MASHSFDDFVQAIGNAVVEVRNKLERQHLNRWICMGITAESFGFDDAKRII